MKTRQRNQYQMRMASKLWTTMWNTSVLVWTTWVCVCMCMWTDENFAQSVVIARDAELKQHCLAHSHSKVLFKIWPFGCKSNKQTPRKRKITTALSWCGGGGGGGWWVPSAFSLNQGSSPWVDPRVPLKKGLFPYCFFPLNFLNLACFWWEKVWWWERGWELVSFLSYVGLKLLLFLLFFFNFPPEFNSN